MKLPTGRRKEVVLGYPHVDLIRALRRSYADGTPIAELMRETGLSRSCVTGIVKGRTHTRVKDDAPSLSERFDELPASARTNAQKQRRASKIASLARR